MVQAVVAVLVDAEVVVPLLALPIAISVRLVVGSVLPPVADSADLVVDTVVVCFPDYIHQEFKLISL